MFFLVPPGDHIFDGLEIGADSLKVYLLLNAAHAREILRESHLSPLGGMPYEHPYIHLLTTEGMDLGVFRLCWHC